MVKAQTLTRRAPRFELVAIVSTKWCLFLARSAIGTEPKAETYAETRRRFFRFVGTSKDGGSGGNTSNRRPGGAW